MIAGSLKYDTKLDTNGLEKGIDGISSKAIALGNLMADAFEKVASAIGDVIAQGVEYNAQIEQYQVALTTLTGSAEKADSIIQQIKEDAAKTPFDVAGLTQANQLLISAGVDSAKAREDVLALGNAISATGGGNAELSRMAVNLQQIKNVGKASALDIKQFAYAGIDVYGLLADSMGIAREEATEMDVTYEDLTKALRKAGEEGGKYFGAMENQSKTLNGQISTLKDNFASFAGEAAEPLFTFLKDEALPIINDLITGNATLEEAIPQLTNTLLEFIYNALTTLLEQLPKILDIGLQVVKNLISGIAKEAPNLINTIYDVVIQLINTILDHLPDLIMAGIDLILALAMGLIEALPDLLDKIPDIITKLVLALTEPEMLAKLITAGIQLLFALGKGLIQAIPKVLTLIPTIIIKLFNGIKDKIANTDWLQLGKNVLTGILNGMLNFGSVVEDTIKKVGKKITSSIKKFFGISSPSKLMAKEVGQYLPKGIAVGIDANTDSALDSIDKMNDEIMDKMNRAVNLETARASFSGTSGSVSEIMNANSIIRVENYNTLELDGEKIYENQETVQRNKNLQYGFGGANSK